MFWFAMLLLFLQSTVKLTPGAESATNRTKPSVVRAGSVTSPASSPPRYGQVATTQALANRLLALEWGEQTRLTIAPTMHLVETEHFLVFSAWNTLHDPALAKVCEEMYSLLRRQFNLAVTEPVWIGKCPIYIFWEPAHFLRFTAEVDRVSRSNSRASHADGYHATRSAFAHIVINGVRDFGSSQTEATRRFYEVLVHEGTHAFLNRYISGGSIAPWVEEGLADFIAATLVPMSEASRKHIEGARDGLRRPNLAARLFGKTELTSTDYGIAQSLVRYLIQTNAKAFIRFVGSMKKGATETDALAEAFGWSPGQLLKKWGAFAKRALGGDAP